MRSKINTNKGMTYVELIVVLSIFAVLSGVSIYNYGAFQAKVDIKSLASDIGLRIVEAQKAALSGKFPPLAQQGSISSTWKPSYGVYFNPSTDNKSFYYFVDLNQDGNFNDTTCLGSGECLQKVTLTKGNTISGISVFYSDSTPSASVTSLTAVFKRPNSAPTIISTPLPTAPVSYFQVSVTSPKSSSNNTAIIKLYPSGRVQIN
jgi:prepilin-type N-terminal cleavage/methylation domain-containing protein